MFKLKYYILLILVLGLGACTILKTSKKMNQFITHNDNDVKTGIWLENIDSSKVLIARYKKGKKEGKAKILYNSGEYEILYYQNDKLNGILKHYMKDGLLCYEVTYKDNKVIKTKRYCGLAW